MSDKTIFQKIIERDIPATIIFEDDQSLAFLDIRPITKGHVLLITKEPYRWMTDVPFEELGTIFQKAQQIMRAQLQGLECDLVQVDIVGEEVPHFHIKLIPRMKNDTFESLASGEAYADGEAQMYAEKIKSVL